MTAGAGAGNSPRGDAGWLIACDAIARASAAGIAHFQRCIIVTALRLWATLR
jgi:hypothetical protein